MENVSIHTIESSANKILKLNHRTPKGTADSNFNNSDLVLGKYKFERLNDSKPKYEHSPESIARQVSSNPKSVSLKITNIMTPTDKIGETEVLYFRSVLEAARVISIKD